MSISSDFLFNLLKYYKCLHPTFAQIVGGGRLKWGKKSSTKWNYCELATHVCRACGSQLPPTVTGTSSSGLWSAVLSSMGRPNSRNMRKKLQTMWRENRANIRVSHVLSISVTSSFYRLYGKQPRWFSVAFLLVFTCHSCTVAMGILSVCPSVL